MVSCNQQIGSLVVLKSSDHLEYIQVKTHTHFDDNILNQISHNVHRRQRKFISNYLGNYVLQSVITSI